MIPLPVQPPSAPLRGPLHRMEPSTLAARLPRFRVTFCVGMREVANRRRYDISPETPSVSAGFAGASRGLPKLNVEGSNPFTRSDSDATPEVSVRTSGRLSEPPNPDTRITSLRLPLRRRLASPILPRFSAGGGGVLLAWSAWKCVSLKELECRRSIS